VELTNHQLTALNAKMPCFFILKQTVNKELPPRPSKQRKSEVDNMDLDIVYEPQVAESRPQRNKKKIEFDEIDSGQKQSEPSKKIQKILQTIKRHPMAEPFLHPVDPKQVPDYYNVIQDPMDLETVERKLKSGEYETGYQFAMDMRLIWSNSFYYNANGSELYHMTMTLSTEFEKLMKGNESLVLVDKKDIIQDLYKKLEKLSKGMKDLQSGKVQTQPTKPASPPKPPLEKPMSLQDKKALCNSIKKLDPKYLRGVLDIVQECMDIQGEELEFDIDKLPSKVCRELDKYVRNCLQNANRTHKKSKPQVVNINGIKNAQEITSNRLTDLDSQLHELAQKSRTEVPAQPEPKDEESESESSSSSESEEDDMPMPAHDIDAYHQYPTQMNTDSMWSIFRDNSIDAYQDFSTGTFSTMMDFDKSDTFK